MASKSQETTTVRTTPADVERMDRLARKLERKHPGAHYKRPGVIAKALDALEKEFHASPIIPRV
jgi:hypothetical protein